MSDVSLRFAPAEPGSRRTAVLSGDLAPGAPDWVYLPLDIPEGVNRIEVGYDYDRPAVPVGALANACDIGVFGPNGFRGWSGGARSEFTLGTDIATPGYLAGPIPPGRWQIVLGPYRVCEAGLRYKVRIAVEFGPLTAGPEPAYPPPATDQTASGWYRGDCHLHSIYSDGRQTPADIATAARTAGLDFVVSTEHNTPAAHGVWGPLAGDDLLIMTGEEVTTRNGHLLAIGLEPGSWIDWRFRAADDRLAKAVLQIHDARGLAVAAHPHTSMVGGGWKFGFEQIDVIEVWNGPWTTDDEAAVHSWDAQLAGPSGHRWRPAMGNSDAHAESDVVGLAQTVLFAESLSRDAVLAAIRAGRSWIAESAAVAVDFTVRAGAGADQRCAGIGERLWLDRDEAVEVRAEIGGITRGLARLITDEGQVHQQPLDPCGSTVIRWRTTASLAAFVRLEVRHRRPDGSLGTGLREGPEPLLGPMAALTNPIFLDTLR